MDSAWAWFLGLESGTRVAVFAAAVSVCGSLITLGSMLIARKSLMLSKAKAARESPGMTSSFRRAKFRAEQGARVFYVDMEVVNRSDTPNAIARAELVIDYELGGRPMTLSLPHDLAQATDFSVPMNIGARSAASGPLRFSASERLFDGVQPLRFVVRLEDAFGRRQELDAGWIAEEASGEQEGAHSGE